jgi:hypothetical protein
MIKKKKVIKEITDKMKKLAHVPIQTWRGWDPNNLFGGCLIFPCLAPLMLQSIKTTNP